jgi:pilus assembly protein TadC
VITVVGGVGTASGRVALGLLLLAVAMLAGPPRAAQPRQRLRLVTGPADNAAPSPTVLGGATPAGAGRGRRADRVLAVLSGLAVGALVLVMAGGVSGAAGGVVAGGVVALAARRWIGGGGPTPAEPLRLAGVLDLFAACLRAGLPVATAVAAVAEQLPGADGRVLRRVAELLATGADAAQAWEPALHNPPTAALARAARRTARSGAALADAATRLAGEVRAAAADLAEERAQRAGVLIAAPLGLCFLPAFFCLGVLPVVIGLAQQLTQHW